MLDEDTTWYDITINDEQGLFAFELTEDGLPVYNVYSLDPENYTVRKCIFRDGKFVDIYNP